LFDARELKKKTPPLWIVVLNPSGEKLLQLFDASELKISAPQCRPPLWSSGQSSWLQIQGSRVPQKKSSGSGTGSTQPCEYNSGAIW
jgi:hypothetical protein